ncbi:MAG: hypothetical protein WGN25_12150 [Candidatus Electrothrix sp. GW3-4]|uniref:hypothetical protein n=1 Tax=Candidatus Electrothrix sp. GW3-4 TaxID=3126740 RepID=UPI0030CD4BDD
MKKIAIFLTLTATAFLLGGCYFPPPPGPGGVRPAARRPYRHPVVVPVPRVIPVPPPVYYYP